MVHCRRYDLEQTEKEFISASQKNGRINIMEKIYEQVEKNIDALVEKGVYWSECADAGEMQDAREGRLRLNFYDSEIPADWLRDVKGKKVLCLAGAGGLQALCRSRSYCT